MQRSLARWLSRYGFDAVCVADGAEALEQLEGLTPNVIVMDLNMAGMDGRELRRRLLASPSLSAIPVIVLSGEAVDDRSSPELRGVQCLTKPVTIEVLVAAIRQCVG